MVANMNVVDSWVSMGRVGLDLYLLTRQVTTVF
jgi:hypothetical protein